MAKASDYIAQVIGGYSPFVVQGGAAVHLIDSLARGGFKYICTAHEQAAGFAADGYAKKKGLGVAISTCGPGATNLVTAAASAFFENVPVLYLVGQQHVFQEIDVVSIFKPVTRFARQVTSVATLAGDLAEALLATYEGPALLNIFDEVYYADIKEEPLLVGIGSWTEPASPHIFGNPRNALPSDKNWDTRGSVNPYHFMQQLNKYQCEMVTDIGNHGVWVKQSNPNVISDNNFGVMGYAIAASMGVACAGFQVACVTGDGAIQMNIQELATIAKHNMDIKIFVLNNGGYGMIQKTQDRWLEGRHSGCDLQDLPRVDFERVATAYGIPNRRWDFHEDMDFEEVFSLQGPVLVNVTVDPDFGVY